MRAIDADLIDMFECHPIDWATGAIDPQEAQDMIDNAPTLEMEPVRYGYCDIKIHHYFEDEDFGDLRFYATIHCSNCGKKLGEIPWLDCIPNPCESYDEEWKINPLDFYAIEMEEARGRLRNRKIDNYCPECGCKMRKENNDESIHT